MVPTPIQPVTESEYWDQQCAAYPFLASDFDPAKVRVPILRNVLGTLKIAIPTNARKATLIQLFHDRAGEPISAFRDYVRKGYADFAKHKDNKKMKMMMMMTMDKTNNKNMNKNNNTVKVEGPASSSEDESTVSSCPEQNNTGHSTRSSVAKLVGPSKQHPSTPFSPRACVPTKQVDKTPASQSAGGHDHGAAGSSRGQKRQHGEDELDAVKRVKAPRKNLAQSRAAVFDKLDRAAVDFEIAKKSCINQFDVMTALLNDMKSNWSLLRSIDKEV